MSMKIIKYFHTKALPTNFLSQRKFDQRNRVYLFFLKNRYATANSPPMKNIASKPGIPRLGLGTGAETGVVGIGTGVGVGVGVGVTGIIIGVVVALGAGVLFCNGVTIGVGARVGVGVIVGVLVPIGVEVGGGVGVGVVVGSDSAGCSPANTLIVSLAPSGAAAVRV
uniref:Uncharacterized protein n=1 Tax=Candidatus Methanophagaceae archaeon ANME-1 ERB6 TaxID=2759912 RepID=A0A7G9Z041_9EURY|nr:hypothetical protein NGENPBHE_00025 [Methanosarcinales archaeon ANME-1 ERB6]